MDDGLIEGVGAMTRFVNLLVADPETSRVPFMIDSSKVTQPPIQDFIQHHDTRSLLILLLSCFNNICEQLI